MSGQRSSNSEGTAESVAAGCNMREVPRIRRETRPERNNFGISSSCGIDGGCSSGGLAVFTWGR